MGIVRFASKYANMPLIRTQKKVYDRTVAWHGGSQGRVYDLTSVDRGSSPPPSTSDHTIIETHTKTAPKGGVRNPLREVYDLTLSVYSRLIFFVN